MAPDRELAGLRRANLVDGLAEEHPDGFEAYQPHNFAGLVAAFQEYQS